MAKAWTLKSRPQGMPQHDNFAMIDLPDAPLTEGQMRVANSWLSVDPYMRGRMIDRKSYVPPFVLGEPMQGGAVGTVLESRLDGYNEGDLVQHMAGWRVTAVVDAMAMPAKLPQGMVPDQHWLSIMGMPGATAWFGLLDVAKAEAGDTVFVSAAAGAVGSVVVQLAKAKGMTVIGSAGGADKAEWVRSIGADHCLDYKAGNLVGQLRAAAPDGINVYFDNVGGDHLDAAIACAQPFARFAMCGMIQGYNDFESGKPTEMRFLAGIVGSRITLRGFIVSDFFGELARFHADMGALIAPGQMVGRETVHQGIEAMPDAFIGLFTGGNTGKMLVRV